VGVAVLDHADSGVLSDLQDVHRETVDLIVDQALPGGTAKIFVFSVSQNITSGIVFTIPGRI